MAFLDTYDDNCIKHEWSLLDVVKFASNSEDEYKIFYYYFPDSELNKENTKKRN